MIEKIICPVWWTNVSTDDRYSKIGINYVPLLAILLRHAYEAYFRQGLPKNKNSTNFNSSFRYIDCSVKT